MRKFAIFLVCVLIAISSIMGCSPREYTPPPPTVPPPPIPVVLITGPGYYSEYGGLVVPSELTKAPSGGIAILEKTIELAPYGITGSSHAQEFTAHYMPDYAWEMADIVIQSDHRLIDQSAVRDTVQWITEPECDEPYTFPISIWSRIFYVNKETRVASTEGSHIVYSTALRLVFSMSKADLSWTGKLNLCNSSDDPAHITYMVYDAGIIKDYQKFLKWTGNLESMNLTEEEWPQALESWNLERIDYRTLVNY